ncbi:hypothetical protein C0995_003308, partial [Termitomyces sp. Mi166
RLDEQIVEPDVREWAAEHIVVHHGTQTNAMFEVLWKAGDKSWMNYEQVRELDLLTPYLELLGLEKIEDLTDKEVGQPSWNDPQIYLGKLDLEGYIGDESEGVVLTKSPSSLVLLSPPTILYFYLSSLSLATAPPLIMGHPNLYGKCRSDNGPGRLQSHPLLAVDHFTEMVTFVDPKHPNELFCVHPLQILLYLDYDKEVNRLFPQDFLPTSFVDPRFKLLVTLGFISRQSNIDKETVEDAVQAWWAPSGQQLPPGHFSKAILAVSPALANSFHTASKPVASKGIVINFPDCKGKGKAIKSEVEPEDVVMTQACKTPLPKDADTEGKLMDYLEDV